MTRSLLAPGAIEAFVHLQPRHLVLGDQADGLRAGRPGCGIAGAPGWAERGWRADLSVGALIGRWRDVVGAEMAEHCTPETFENGRLVIRTDSTAWATQLKLLEAQMLTALTREVGEDVVREIAVLGPAGRSWGRGVRRVPGRGPRDTYG